MNVQESQQCVTMPAPGEALRRPKTDERVPVRFCLPVQPIDAAMRNDPARDEAPWPRIFPGL